MNVVALMTIMDSGLRPIRSAFAGSCALSCTIGIIGCPQLLVGPDPIVDLKLLRNRNFGTAVFLQLVLGMVLFGSTVLIPQYLQVLLGYTAERAGMVLSPAGFMMMIMMGVAGRSLGKIDPRLMTCLGYIATAAGIYNLTRLDLISKSHFTGNLSNGVLLSLILVILGYSLWREKQFAELRERLRRA